MDDFTRNLTLTSSSSSTRNFRTSSQWPSLISPYTCTCTTLSLHRSVQLGCPTLIYRHWRVFITAVTKYRQFFLFVCVVVIQMTKQSYKLLSSDVDPRWFAWVKRHLFARTPNYSTQGHLRCIGNKPIGNQVFMLDGCEVRSYAINPDSPVHEGNLIAHISVAYMGHTKGFETTELLKHSHYPTTQRNTISRWQKYTTVKL